jgi:hypothetical protein
VDDAYLLILEILEAFVHPDYIQGRAYFDIAILVTENVTFSEGIKPVFQGNLFNIICNFFI